MSQAETVARSFADMPLVLKGVTSFFLVFGLGSIVLALVPGIEHRVAGSALSAGELWRSGHGPFALAMGLWLVVAALGLLRRASWAGALVMAAYVPFVIAEATLSGSPRLARQALLALAWAASAAVYLRGTRAAVTFFSGGPR